MLMSRSDTFAPFGRFGVRLQISVLRVSTRGGVRSKVSANGGIDEHVRGLVDLGILTPSDPDAGRIRYRRAEPEGDLADRLRSLLDALDAIPDGPMPRNWAAPPTGTRRPYTRRALGA